MANLLRLLGGDDDSRRSTTKADDSATPAAPSTAKGTFPHHHEEPSTAPTAPVPPRATTPSPVKPAEPTANAAPPDPVADGADDGTAPSSPRGAENLYVQVLSAVSRLFEAAAVADVAPGTLRPAIDTVAEFCPAIVQAALTDRGLLRKAMGTYAEGEGFILPHTVNVAVLGVELGHELGRDRHSLLDICLAGLVHDLGSVRLPEGLLTKPDSLTPDEWDEMRARPEYTYEVLSDLGDEYTRAAQIAYQVYERLDGSGYPRGLKGDEILPEALVLGTVDFFESFAHPRPYKTVLPGNANHGIRMLMQMADKFGSANLKALVGSVGLFPIGSYVRLSSTEVGRVIDVQKENPMRPQVEILLDGERRRLRKTRILDLQALPHIYVSRALTASDLRELGLLPPPSPVPPSEPGAGES